MADIPTTSVDGSNKENEPEEVKKLEFRLRLLKEEVASQANIFDQIDSKTGVALGFTFVVVGQVLAAVYHMATEQHRLLNVTLTTAYAVNIVFGMAAFLTLLAFICGAMARAPRDFCHSNKFDTDQISGTYVSLLRISVQDFDEIARRNDEANALKSKWAKKTYVFVGCAIIAYLFLTVLLYSIAVR